MSPVLRFGSVAEAFADAAARWPDHDFLQVLPEAASALGVEPRAWTYREVQQRAVELRDAYRQAGLGSGQRAGVLLQNRPEFLFHWLALNGLGVSVVPINPDWRSGELEYVIGHAEIDLVACLPARADALRAAAAAIGRTLAVVAPDGAGIGAVQAAVSQRGAAVNADTECALLYTSGTTGRSKGCVLPNEYFLWAGEWYTRVGGLCEIRPGEERMLTPLPLTHMNAMAYSVMCMVFSGGCLILLDRFHPATWWHSVRESRASIVHYLGVMPAMLLGAGASAADREHLVRFGFGAGVNPRHHAAFEARFGFPLLEAWAMTETGAGAVIIANREPRHAGTACFGAAEPAVDCRVVDDAGEDVADGQPGELWCRHAGERPGFGFFREYLKDASATREAWAQGWFHTGDLVMRDASGQFHFIDRKKNVIRRSGENISAVEVESVLAQHPAVRAVGVTAVPDPVRGDEVMACIVPAPGVEIDEDLAVELAEFCRERLAYFKAPGYLAFCAELPLTPTEKLQRPGLKSLAIERLEAGSCSDLRSLKRRIKA